MKKLDITDMRVATGNAHKMFSLKANGIEISCSCTLQEFNEKFDETMDKVNENFRNSLRYIRLYGDLPSNPDPKKLSVWTHTDTGLAVRGNKLPVPEFQPFTFS